MTSTLARLRFGLVLPTRVAATPTAAAEAERLGFDYLACGEHVVGHGECHNALVSLSYAAARTTHIELLTAVTLTPLYPPALLAKMTATLDVLSGGRLNVGLGVGGEFPAEFEACGIPRAERGERTTEAIGVLRALWSGAPVAFDGRFTRFPTVTLDPPPHRLPPIWVGGRREPALRRAALYGDFWLPYLVTPEAFERGVRLVSDLAGAPVRTIGGKPVPFVQLVVSVTGDHRTAERTGEAFLDALYPSEVAPAVSRYVLAGRPEQVRSRILEYADAGAAGAIIGLACPDEEYPRMARVLAQDVLGLPARNR